MKWTDIPHGTIAAAQQRLWIEFGDEAGTVAIRINTDPGFVTWLAALAVNPPFADKWCTSLNAQWLRAREIMGENFLGVEEAIRHFGVSPSKPQIAALAEIPWSEEVLESVKDTHILVAVFPISIVEIRKRVHESLFRQDHEYSTPRYLSEVFARERGEACWQLVRKTPVDSSLSTTLNPHARRIGDSEETPSARVMTYTIIGHFKVTGERLFKSVYVRTSDSAGNVVKVGCFRENGLDITDSHQHDDCGLASARKS